MFEGQKKDGLSFGAVFFFLVLYTIFRTYLSYSRVLWAAADIAGCKGG